MLSSRLIRCTSILAIAGVSIPLVGCQSASSQRASSSAAPDVNASSFEVSMAAVNEEVFSHQHQFYYYPNAGVYRDCDEDRWLWSDDDGLTWNFGTNLPQQIVLGDEIPFAVILGLNDPASEHQTIAAAYPDTGATAPATATAHGSNDF